MALTFTDFVSLFLKRRHSTNVEKPVPETGAFETVFLCSGHGRNPDLPTQVIRG